ncbi:hypothetical protein [Streptomyces sp. NPDC127038]|uniref:hypothetical protein n=1 Tax=Streptomyces sp. NPDC127038 TaxID=3347114 RepID=UPI003666F62F
MDVWVACVMWSERILRAVDRIPGERSDRLERYRTWSTAPATAEALLKLLLTLSIHALALDAVAQGEYVRSTRQKAEPQACGAPQAAGWHGGWVTTSSCPAVLVLTSGEGVAVDAELGAFSPAGSPEWGGVLLGEPARVAVAMRSSGRARLRFPGGRERRIRPEGAPYLDRRGRLLVPFVGEGQIPSG